MANALRFERALVALVLGVASSAACGGTATETGPGTGGTGSAGTAGSAGTSSGGTSSAGTSSGGTSNGGTSSGGTSSGGTSSGGTSSAGTSSAGTSSGGTSECDQAKDGYSALVKSLLAQSKNTACTVNTDCTYLQTSGCGNDCSVSVASAAAGPAITSELDAFAQKNCASCEFTVLPCAALLIPATRCVAGKCE